MREVSSSPGTSFLARFFATESAAGLTLIAAAVVALGIANSPASASYFSLLHREALGMSFAHWINDGLMAIFFLLVGLEIKREFIVGQLATWTQRALPGIAALGGMIVPALIYLIVNSRNPETLRGWAIPAATDIAFALGVLSLLGKRVPTSLKIFLTALAVLDDLGAVIIIAIFYTSELHAGMLMCACIAIAVLVMMNRFGVTHLAPYLIVGVTLWYFALQSGVHATLAGVALALCIPIGNADDRKSSPLLRLEENLHSWVAFGVVPIFGLANAGVSLSGISLRNLIDPVPLGIVLGLLLGKQIGIFASSAIAIRAGIARLPEESSWLQLYGVSLICGIGFTMSLFIGSLAFANSAHLIDEVKIGVLIGSVLAAVAGVVVLRCAPSFTRPKQ